MNVALCGVLALAVWIFSLTAVAVLSLKDSIIPYVVFLAAMYLIMLVLTTEVFESHSKKLMKKYSLDPVALWASYALFPTIASFIVSFPRIEYNRHMSGNDFVFLYCISPIWIYTVFAAVRGIYSSLRHKAEKPLTKEEEQA
ncbi:MAG: hypothetical protein K6F91_00525 [Ruminococcus sp.]|nr:hypothetical protein [Ruminococcus sp.]